MQIVIDIDEKTYNEIMDDAKNTPRNLSHYERIIANSTPLDKIRAEIEQKQYDFMDDKDYDEGIRFGLMLAYQIIDKYKAESEDI